MTQRTQSYLQDGRGTVVDRFGVWLSARQIRRAVPTFAGKRVGDFGCGFQASFSRTIAGDVAGLTLVDVALADDLKADARIRAIEGQLPGALAALPAASLDVVMIVSVLEHVTDPAGLLREVRRLLAPGGVALVNVPSWRGKRYLELATFRLHLGAACRSTTTRCITTCAICGRCWSRPAFAPARSTAFRTSSASTRSRCARPNLERGPSARRRLGGPAVVGAGALVARGRAARARPAARRRLRQQTLRGVVPAVRGAYIGVEHGATFARTEAGAHAGPDVIYGGGTLPFRDGSFDTVLSVQVLEHTPRPAALVAEMARVLASDGILILTAPFQFRLHEQPHDYFRYSSHGLRQLCDDAGLEVFETIAQGSLWSVVGHKLNSYLALRVARVGQLAQRMGKLPHEAHQSEGVRWWTLPVVGPGIVSIAAAARVLDRVLPDPEETLGFLVLARRR